MNRLATKQATLMLAASLMSGLCLSCATRAPTTAAEPTRAGDAPAATPVLLTLPADRRAEVAKRWDALLREQNITATTSPDLAPATSTITRLPALPAALRLPSVGDPRASGDAREANEREALRRFLERNVALTGADPATLSLVRIETLAGEARRAIYEQRPFLYPLRGGYGSVEIDYAGDRITNLTSTALPAAETAEQALRDLRAALTADEARARLADGAAQATELVVIPTPRPAAGDGAGAQIELRLAWEFRTGAGDRFAYVDALRGEIINLK